MATDRPSRLSHLADRMLQLCEERPFRTGWHLEDIRSGTVMDRNGQTEFPASSTRKVAIMMAALEAVAAGSIDLDQPVVIDARYREDVILGVLQNVGPGLTLSLRDAITLMIVVSDNLCTAHVAGLVGLDAVNDLCARIGLENTCHRHVLIPRLHPDHALDATNTTSPGDQGRLYRAILDGMTGAAGVGALECGPELSGLALDILQRQVFRMSLPGLLPHDAVVAHKTGLGWRDVSDGGIVFDAGRPAFILTAYIDNVATVTSRDGIPDTIEASRLIAELSRACWDEIVLADSQGGDADSLSARRRSGSRDMPPTNTSEGLARSGEEP